MPHPNSEASNNNDLNNILKGYKMLLYFTGSMIVNEPTNECISDFWSKGILTSLPIFSNNPRFIEAASQLRSSCKERMNCISILQQDFSRLFNKSKSALALPFSDLYPRNGLYLTRMNPDHVSIFYINYGWKNAIKSEVGDNHLGTKLLFLTFLIDQFFEIDDNACRKEMKNEIRRFISNHILSWVSRWNEKVQEYAVTLCYKGIATMIIACSEDIYDILENL